MKNTTLYSLFTAFCVIIFGGIISGFIVVIMFLDFFVKLLFNGWKSSKLGAFYLGDRLCKYLI